MSNGLTSRTWSIVLPLICLLLCILLIGLGMNIEKIPSPEPNQFSLWLIPPYLVGKLVGKLGEIVFVLGVFHVVFDYFVTKRLVHESTRAAVQSDRVASSGIEDFWQDSERVDYISDIAGSGQLIIGMHYSSRILARYTDLFVERAKKNKKTQILALGIESAAITYLAARRGKAIDVGKKLTEVEFHISEIKRKSGKADCIEMVHHSAVLSYSFVLTDQHVWVKPNRNANGYEATPAVKVSAGYPLFTFFEKDIKDFTDEMKKAPSANEAANPSSR